ncbi:MAG: LuxR C-terminal-related transcriptional regulator [Bacteroidota bacterium]
MRNLTPKEEEIIRLAGQGKPRREIAKTLNVKEGTINTHFKSIYIKTGAHSMAEIAIWAVRMGYV